MQPCKEQDLYWYQRFFLYVSSFRLSIAPFSSPSRFQSFNMNLGMLAMQTAQFLTEFSQIYLIDNSV